MSLPNTHLGYEKIKNLLSGCHSVFFIGIGGINMSSLALMTAQRGFRVAGSDRMRTAITEELEKEGIIVFYAHNAENVKDFDAVVYTVAIPEDNPEYIAAKNRGVPIISRADYLGYIMCAYGTRIGVCGMHGKSTTTSMLAEVFIDNGMSPTVMCGAEVGRIGGAYCLGQGDNFIFEACEYKDSFLDFYPNIAVVLNIEPEHMDYFKDLDHIKRSFAEFVSKCGKDGVAVINADDENVMQAIPTTGVRTVTFGLSENADYRAKNITHKNGGAEFDLFVKGKERCRVRLPVVGVHNVMNCLPSFAVADICGLSADAVAESLSSFKGAARRMQFKGKFRSCDVFDDYAHHPTEVKASLLGAKNMGYGRTVCVFQPHTFSRLHAFYSELVSALDEADLVIMADVYAAREVNVYGVTSADVAKSLGTKGRYGTSLDQIKDILSEELSDGDLLIVMGAGDIYKLFDLIIDNNNKK